MIRSVRPAPGLRSPSVAMALALALASARGASAAVTSDAAAAADTLFQQGRALMVDKKIHEACAKFGASYKLDRKLGTLLNWADCLEKDGKTGSAFERFGEAVDWAKSRSDERLEYATKRRDALEPKVAKLRIVATLGAEKLTVRRDGEVVAEEAYGLPIVVDPGTIELSILRGDEELEHRKVTSEEGREREVQLDLAAIAKAHPAKLTGPIPKGQRNAGFVVGGVGIAGLAVFGILEGVAYGQKAKANAVGACRNGFCSPEGYALHQRAGDFAEAGQWVGIASAAVLAVGATLLITAPRTPSASPMPKVGLVPFATPSSGGVVCGGSF